MLIEYVCVSDAFIYPLNHIQTKTSPCRGQCMIKCDKVRLSCGPWFCSTGQQMFESNPFSEHLMEITEALSNKMQIALISVCPLWIFVFQNWLDPSKEIKKQLHSECFSLFSVDDKYFNVYLLKLKIHLLANMDEAIVWPKKTIALGSKLSRPLLLRDGFGWWTQICCVFTCIWQIKQIFFLFKKCQH